MTTTIRRATEVVPVPKRPIYPYTSLMWSLIYAIDQGRTLSIEEVSEHVRDGTLLGWLSTEHGIDASFFGGKSLEGHEALELFEGLDWTVDAARKFGVEHNGLMLVLAYCLEAVQQLVGPE